MANIAVQLTIGDYEEWRLVFDQHKHLRDEAGIRSEQVYVNADDTTQVLLWFDVADPTKARQAIQGDAIKEAMKEGGVVGPPKIHAVS
jgi:hypothetical protein